MKTRVLVVGPIPPPYYGVAIATDLIVNSSCREEFELYHLNTSDSREHLNFNRLDIVNVYLALKHIFQLVRLIQKHRPDVIYIPISQAPFGYFRDALFIFISFFYRARIVLHLRGSGFKSFYQNSIFPLRWIIRRSISLTDRMIVLGESLRNQFERLLPPEKLRVVPNGINPGNFSPGKSDWQRNGVVRICFLSNLIRTKGYREVLEALKILALKYRVEGVFAGKWENETDKTVTFDYIEKNSLHNVVKFIGVAKGEVKKNLLASSDIFVMPTYYPLEGHPWAILEAMATGLPVITTDHGCIAETVIDGENGYLVPKQNVPELVKKIEELIIDPELRLLMGRKGRQRIENIFSEDNFIKRLGDVFREFQI